MKTQFICLANSYKEGGRCLAGIEFKDGIPVFEDGIPKWIRPVSEKNHGEISNFVALSIEILNILEIEITEYVPYEFQTENVLFVEASLKIVGKYEIGQLLNLCNHQNEALFGNKSGRIIPDDAELLLDSLKLIAVKNPIIIEKEFEDRKYPKLRLAFYYKNDRYELPITDPIFLNLYKTNKQLLPADKTIFLTLSLGILYEDWHHKLVAAIIV